MIKTNRDQLKPLDVYYQLLRFSMWEFSKPNEYVYYKTVRNEVWKYRIAKCVRKINDNGCSFIYLKKDEVTKDIKEALGIVEVVESGEANDDRRDNRRRI